MELPSNTETGSMMPRNIFLQKRAFMMNGANTLQTLEVQLLRIFTLNMRK